MPGFATCKHLWDSIESDENKEQSDSAFNVPKKQSVKSLYRDIIDRQKTIIDSQDDIIARNQLIINSQKEIISMNRSIIEEQEELLRRSGE